MKGGGIIKRLKFNYDLTAAYSEEINNHSFSVLCIPQDTQRQKIRELDISTDGGAVYQITNDSFLNKKLYGKINAPHKSFGVHISGIADAGIDIFEEYTDYPFGAILYKAQTELTRPGESLTRYHNSFSFKESDGVYDRVLKIMRDIPNVFEYSSGSTRIHETAEGAFTLGKGVCQDYAHIMLSLLRMEHIPARYVVGMMLGEGSSHAWVEALCKGYWYGFDPTNNKLVNDEYIRVSCGRDSSDCPVIKGSFYGGGVQKQSEFVSVEEINEKD